MVLWIMNLKNYEMAQDYPGNIHKWRHTKIGKGEGWKRKGKQRTVSIKIFTENLKNCFTITIRLTVNLSTDLYSWCSGHNASTKNFVDMTSPVFDIFSTDKSTKHIFNINARQRVEGDKKCINWCHIIHEWTLNKK